MKGKIRIFRNICLLYNFTVHSLPFRYQIPCSLREVWFWLSLLVGLVNSVGGGGIGGGGGLFDVCV
jgi:hypothetical protein